ncbi:zinc knuckle domain-containing protein [Toxoplasma gondii MAS]|uniref:Branchpoint-bridging protein n=2 Tax=Toxoplasma gondii TaxID=5811 RepID=A0A2G8Y0F1_TOXGO|nr:zinc knuckle domain-containing protein [Toxoplasma gondii MAS]PIM00743.1 zinc knuckle domain-containing protein [Toxoplasma gondii COUG]
MSMEQLMALVPLEAALAGKEKGGRKSRWERPKTKKKGDSKWGPPEDKDFLPPPYVDLPVGMTAPQMDRFLREQRFDDLQRKLANGEFEFGDPDIRPPSPPPVYDRNGGRINTREVRVRSAMVAEQQRLTEFMVKHLPGFVPPPDWKPSKKIRRIEIPLDKYPDYNFMGIIIGPRGCNHKRLEAESGTTISVRGRGTQKEGKRDHQTEEEASMPMHVHICGDTEEAVEKALALIEPLLDPLHPAHEEFKKRGLEQLALVNGVNYSDLEQRRCPICQGTGHTAQDCPDAQELQPFKKPEVRCALCGDFGHVTMDCKLRQNGPVGVAAPPPPPPTVGRSREEQMKMDAEYRKMMSELTGDSTLDALDEPTLSSPEQPSNIARASPYASATPGAQTATPPPGVSPSFDRSSPSPYAAYGRRGGRMGGPVPPPPPMAGPPGEGMPGGFACGPTGPGAMRGRPGLGYCGSPADGPPGGFACGPTGPGAMRGRPGLGYGGRGGRMFGGDDDRNAFMRRGGPEFWRDNGDRGDGEFGSNDPRSWGRGNDGMRPGGGPGGRSPYPEIMMPPMGVPGMPPPWGGVPPPSMMGGPAMSQPSGPDGSGPGGPGPNRMGGPASGGGPNYSWAQGPFPGAFAPPVWGQHSGSIGPGSSPGASDAGGAARPAAGGRGGFEPWGFSGASGAPQEPHSGAASGTGPFPPLPMAPAGAPPPAPDADDGLDKNDDDNMDMND